MVSAKRKRAKLDDGKSGDVKRPAVDASEIVLQVTCGSYERVLHGFTVSIPKSTLKSTDDTSKPSSASLSFSDSFLFNAHASAIRCLALSPASDATPQQKSRRILATGSTDERINVYQLSTAAPPALSTNKPAMLIPLPSADTRRNKEIGTMMHHSSAVTALHFSSRGKLLSASMDNTIAIARTRDWTVLSTIKAPIPKSAGRPSGDTFAPGEVPAGINGIAVHPSAKLMLSVGQGEKCMRLWNLVTGKKAGVLTFDKKLLQEIGEARYRGGEARQVVWAPDGEEFAIAFERGLLVYGLDCKVRAVVSVGVRTKLCTTQYLPPRASVDADGQAAGNHILAISTEDGRILLYNTLDEARRGSDDDRAPILNQIAQIGQQQPGNRVKDFVTIEIATGLVFVTAGSSGRVCVWFMSDAEHSSVQNTPSASTTEKTKDVGTLLGTYETTRRITCLTAFMMDQSSDMEELVASNGANGLGSNGHVQGNAPNTLDVGVGKGDGDDEFEGFDED